MRKLFLSFILALLTISLTNAQTLKSISGVVSDGKTKVVLSFVAVSVKNQFVGTTTNEKGEFELHLPDSLMNDTLVVNYLGYKPEYIAINTIDKPLNVELLPNTFELKEVTIRPLLPADYIRQAMRKVKVNYPDKPFNTEAYLRKKVTENKIPVNFDEAIFKTYYPNYQDTLPDQHQLMLYRKAADKDIAFMKEKREAMKKKADEKKAKELAKSKDKPLNKDSLDAENEKKSIAELFAGPDKMLQLDIIKEKPDFLDTTKLKDFDYSFGPASTYQGNEVVLINFKSDGKVDHARTEGKIYIDLQTDAIVNVDFDAEFVIPLMYRPIIFMAGYSVSNPMFNEKISYQEVNDKWYPLNFQFNLQVKLERNYWFKKNDVSDLFVEGVFSVNKISVNNVTQIPLAKRFDAKKKMESQVYNDEGLSWDMLNIIKK